MTSLGSARLALAAALGVSLGATSAAAADLGKPGELFTIEIHGFVSQGFLWSSANNYLTYSSDGSFDLSEAGVNFTVPIADRLRVGMQLFAEKLGPSGDYRPSFDWFYLDYHWQDWLGVRAGRVKIPFGLYNEITDVNAARPTVLLPQSVYPVPGREFLLAQTGVEVYGILNLCDAGALDYNLYAGTIFVDPEQLSSSAATASNIRVPFVVGGRVMWHPPVDGLRLGFSLLEAKLEGRYHPTSLPDPIDVALNGRLWVGSIEYTADDFTLAAEYSRWRLDLDSESPLLPGSVTTSDRAYAMGAYRLNPAWQLSLYYSLYFPDASQRRGIGNQQHDVALTVRHDLNAYWLIKLEGHVMRGTADLDPDLNGGTPRDQLEPTWGLFLLETTAYF